MKNIVWKMVSDICDRLEVSVGSGDRLTREIVRAGRATTSIESYAVHYQIKTLKTGLGKIEV